MQFYLHFSRKDNVSVIQYEPDQCHISDQSRFNSDTHRTQIQAATIKQCGFVLAAVGATINVFLFVENVINLHHISIHSFLFKVPIHNSFISRHFTCSKSKTAPRTKFHTKKPRVEPDSVLPLLWNKPSIDGL